MSTTQQQSQMWLTVLENNALKSELLLKKKVSNYIKSLYFMERNTFRSLFLYTFL